MKKLVLVVLFLVGSLTISNAQFYLNEAERTYAIIPYGTFIMGNSYGIAVDAGYLGGYLDFGSQKIDKNVYEGNYMTFGLMAEPLPSMYFMVGLGSFEMYEQSQYFGYDFKFMYDIVPHKYSSFVIAPMVNMNSIELSFGIGIGLKMVNNKR